MSAFTSASVRRGPWEMSPVLLLVLLASLVAIASGQSAEDDDVTNTHYSDEEEVTTTDSLLIVSSEAEGDPGDPGFTTIDPSVESENTSIEDVLPGPENNDTTLEVEDEPLSTIIILVPVVLVVVIIGMIVCGIAVSRKWNQKATTSDGMHDSYLNASSTEKVPMPMFDDDIPSVLELEMEDMDQWVEKQA